MNYTPLSKLYYKDKAHYEEIYQNRLHSESSVRLNFSITEHPAFFQYNSEMLLLTSAIYQKNAELIQLKYSLPSIALEQFRLSCLIDEIKITNEIEGVHSTRKEINDILQAKMENSLNQRLFGLVKKYDLLSIDDLSISTCADIRTIYDELVLPEVISEDHDNVPDGLYFRQNSVMVYDEHMKCIHHGVMPETKIIALMDESLKTLNDSKTPLLIGVSFFHYMFGYIHPFYDGNGRTSRFISSYLLAKGLDALVSYNLSYTIKKNIKQYYRAFQTVNDPKNKGDITPFILSFLEILLEAVTNLCDRLTDKNEKLSYYMQQIQSLSTDQTTYAIMTVLIQNTLYGFKGISVAELSHICEYSESTVRNILKKLEKQQLLRTSKDGRKLLYDLDLDII
ncbi:MAG: Fic family protein [Firmicutes bacterium]|uniref:Fic family protein n=1 Tax=Candidatus Scybalomonas excrementavium TaxID=2840943 RepID=A0A9D9I0M3_9FIRM|nr:Fic family protein [Candidatus Scybalomonas excrementavium]